ncbi:MAG: transglycosylase domain-containing protein [Gemmatimonadota bacterium]
MTWSSGAAYLRALSQRARPRHLAVAILAVTFFDITLYATCGLRGCPDPELLKAYQPGGATVLLDREGRKFGDLAPVERRMAKMTELPDHLPAAFIAVEDKRFFDHHGVDWRRVAAAALHNLLSGGVHQGSSTITMQLSRNIFSAQLRADDRSLRRKLFEARVAGKIERRFTKNEILELYFNHIYFGGGAYGVENAARYYFETPARELKLHEAALLAALPKAPARYDPREHARRARERRDLVLRLMAEQGRVSMAAAASARRLGLGVTHEPPALSNGGMLAPYYVQLIRQQLEKELGDEIYRRRLQVFTSLDGDAQRAAEQAVRRQLRLIDHGGYGNFATSEPVQAAVVVMETLTGDVLAVVGGRDFTASRYNRAVHARRQAGSAFKPFVYAAALDEGYPPSQPIIDAPYTFVSHGEKWQPRNFDGRYYGQITLREALAYSRNVPAVRLANAVGPEAVAQTAKAAGIRAEIERTPMIALGITEVSPLELAGAYATFAGMGTRAEPRFVHRVEGEDGKILFQTKVRRKEAVDRAIAFMLTDMLADAVDFGTGTAVRKGGYRGPAAGKTGTTDDNADAWFVGYTPDLVAGVWIGYDERRPLPPRATGGTVAAPLWGHMMRAIYQTRRAPRAWLIPGEIEIRMTDPASGRVLAKGCEPLRGEPREEVFLKDEEVEEVCPKGEPQRSPLGIAVAWLGRLFRSDGADTPRRDRIEARDEDLGTVRLIKRREKLDDGHARPDDSDRGERGKGKRGRGGRDHDSDSESDSGGSDSHD